MRDAPRSRARAVSTFVFILVCMGASFAACAQYKRNVGEDCLKNEDCLTGICSGLQCANAPPLLPSGVGYPDSGGGSDSSPGADTGGGGGDSGGDAPSDSGSDGDGPAGPVDSGHDASDASSGLDASDASSLDASDASNDVLELPDVVLDAPDLDVVLDVNLPG